MVLVLKIGVFVFLIMLGVWIFQSAQLAQLNHKPFSQCFVSLHGTCE